MKVHKNENLQLIPGVGSNLAKCLADLGYWKISDLKKEDPEEIYQNLMGLHGKHIDRCVLYTFRCAVKYSKTRNADLKWWNFKD